jgi:hypothetical protein
MRVVHNLVHVKHSASRQKDRVIAVAWYARRPDEAVRTIRVNSRNRNVLVEICRVDGFLERTAAATADLVNKARDRDDRREAGLEEYCEQRKTETGESGGWFHHDPRISVCAISSIAAALASSGIVDGSSTAVVVL